MAETQGKLVDRFEPGQRVAVTQQTPRGNRVLTAKVTGEVVRYDQRSTGSWYAHSKADKLWLDRLELKKDDGEIVICNLDQYSHIELLPPKPEPPKPTVEEASEDATPEALAEDAQK